MDKICRSMTTFYRLPKINLNHNIRFATPASAQVNSWNQLIIRHYNTSQKPPSNQGLSQKVEQPKPIADILEREIQDESAELSQHLSTDQFPGFSVETEDSDVKLTKQIGNTTVTVRFTVSSSLNEWPSEPQEAQQSQQQQQSETGGDLNMTLLSMPEFQVQISKNNHTLELSCYFEDMDTEDESGEPYPFDPIFGIDELVMYEGEPKETEFAVNAEYFQEDLQTALIQYLAEHGIDDEFAKNLVSFATSYEKKQYIGLMTRLKNFVSK